MTKNKPTSKPVRILALDPGSVNYGWACLEVDRKRVRIVRNGMLNRDNLVKELVPQLQDNVRRYRRSIRRLLIKSRATILVSERYSTRIRGTTGEAVNMMIGLAAAEMLDAHESGVVQVYMSMTWKARLKKALGTEIKVLYKSIKGPAHPIDACLIGLYWAEKNMEARMLTTRQMEKQIRETRIGI